MIAVFLSMLISQPTVEDVARALAEADRQLQICKVDLNAAQKRLLVRTSTASSVMLVCPQQNISCESRPWWADLATHGAALALGAWISKQ